MCASTPSLTSLTYPALPASTSIHVVLDLKSRSSPNQCNKERPDSPKLALRKLSSHSEWPPQ